MWMTRETLSSFMLLVDIFFFKFVFLFIFMCVGILPTFMSLYCVHAVPREDRRGYQVPWNWRNRQL